MRMRHAVYKINGKRTLLTAAFCVALNHRRKRRLRRHRFWIHPIDRNRDIHGDYNHLIPELRTDAQLFKKYFRLTVEQFDIVLSMIGSSIQLQNTRWRRNCLPYVMFSVGILVFG